MNFVGQFLLVGFSGGPDSVVLLHMLSQQTDRDHLLVTHCNFHLRGDESDRDQHFCEEMCRRLQLPLEVRHFDTFGYMKEHRMSLEMAARELRYAWWEELAARKEAETGMPVRIAVGHHLDDSIETMLMNLMRGTGLQGLTGIREENGRIVRPLSHMTRAEILAYIDREHLTYVTDSTNLENDTIRNQIRNQLIPLMTGIVPQSREGLALTMHNLRQEKILAEERLGELFADTQHCTAAGMEWDEWTLPAEVADEDTVAALLHHWSEQHPGARRHNRLFYTEMQPAVQPTADPVLSECVDADRVQWPVTVRHWQQGDRMQPLGMKGTKLVSDLFCNAHFSPNRKATTWIVADAAGRIVWVAGLRMADWCKVTGDTSRRVRISLVDAVAVLRDEVGPR